MIYKEKINDKAVEYIKAIEEVGGKLNYGNMKHDIYHRTGQTLVDGKYNNEPNQYDEGKKLAWEHGLMENVRGFEGSYIEVRISMKGWDVLKQAK